MPRGGAAPRGACLGPKSAIDRLVRHPAERERLELALALGVSPRRLLGWEPEKRHEHYDAAGNLTGYTLVTRDAEFEDGDLERLLALRRYQAEVCDCGIHESQTADKSNVFTFDKRTCPVCKGLAQYQRILAAEDRSAEDQVKDAPPATPRPSDGRRLYVRQLSPVEVAERRQRVVTRGGGGVATERP